MLNTQHVIAGKRNIAFLPVLSRLVSLLALALIVHTVEAQSVSRKHMSAKHQQYYDSLKNMNYDRALPIFGTKVYKRGFDIPFPFGIMVNTFYGRQGIDISNINIGIKGPNESLGPVNLDGIIEFSKVEATAMNINIRTDAWIFPFLDVYVMLNYLPYAKTHVELSKPISLVAEPKQTGWAYGFGLMGAFGFGPLWLSMDYSLNWAEMELLQNKVLTQIAGLRLGHVITNKHDAEKNISLWIGMMGIFLNNETIGEIAMTEIFPGLGEPQLNQAQQNYNNNPATTAPKKQVLDWIIDKIRDRLNGLPVEDMYITYQMDKSPSSKWAGLVGGQYQFNKRWQLRAECNFIGKDRLSGLLSINYRFLGFKKKNTAVNQ